LPKSGTGENLRFLVSLLLGCSLLLSHAHGEGLRSCEQFKLSETAQRKFTESAQALAEKNCVQTNPSEIIHRRSQLSPINRATKSAPHSVYIELDAVDTQPMFLGRQAQQVVQPIAQPIAQPPAQPVAMSSAEQQRIERLLAAAREKGVDGWVLDVARDYGINPLLLHSIIHVESRHQASAVSPMGARGLMQVMPATAKGFGVKDANQLSDPAVNLRVGAAYLRKLDKMFDGDLTLILAGYNAGEGAVIKSGYKIPRYAETQAYVRDVLRTLHLLHSAKPKSTS
jgi:soluble lytic murein transglycosylase-like protein